MGNAHLEKGLSFTPKFISVWLGDTRLSEKIRREDKARGLWQCVARNTRP